MKYRKIVLAVIASLACLGLYLFWTNLVFLSIFVRDALWASVLVTTVLVVINAYYAWQSRQTVCEMEKARKAEFYPHVRADLSSIGPVFLVLKLTNFGKGPATNIKAKITFLPSNETRNWDQAIMSPNEFIRIILPEGHTQRVSEKSATITIKGKYEDIFGQTFEMDETIDAKEFIKQIEGLQKLLEKDIVDEIEGMKDELGRVVTEVRGIRSDMERIRRINQTEKV